MLNIDFLQKPKFHRLTKNWLAGVKISESFEIDGRSSDYEPIYNYSGNEEIIGYVEDYELIKYDDDFEPATIVAKYDNKIIGFYSGNQSWVERDHRNNGLAKAMIVASIASFKILPLEEEEPIGMSEGGYQAHRSALDAILLKTKYNRNIIDIWSDEETEKFTKIINTKSLSVNQIYEIFHGKFSENDIRIKIKSIIFQKDHNKWTPIIMKKLLTLVETENYSYSQLAAKLGPQFSRNAVAGKLQRLGVKLNTDVKKRVDENQKIKDEALQEKRKLAALKKEQELEAREQKIALKKLNAKPKGRSKTSLRLSAQPDEEKTFSPNAFFSMEKEKDTAPVKLKRIYENDTVAEIEPENKELESLTADQRSDYDQIDDIKPLVFGIENLKLKSCREPYFGEKSKMIFYCGRECNKNIAHKYCTHHAKKNLAIAVVKRK